MLMDRDPSFGNDTIILEEVIGKNWDEFASNQKNRTAFLDKLAQASENIPDLNPLANDILGIWAIMMEAGQSPNKEETFRELYKAVYQPEDTDYPSSDLAQKLKSLLGSESDPAENGKFKNPDYKGPRLLRGTTLENMLLNWDSEDKEKYLTPLDFVRSTINNLAEMFRSDAKDRLNQNANDNEELVSRTARFAAARSFLITLAEKYQKAGLNSNELQIVLNSTTF